VGFRIHPLWFKGVDLEVTSKVQNTRERAMVQQKSNGYVARKL
jgi:aspartate carbamoyltransferase catalytic subunit